MNRSKRIRQFSIVVLSLLFSCLLYVFYLQFSSKEQPVPEGFRPLAEGFYSSGIDVSHHQGTIDWDQLFDETDTVVSFVFCKATEGVNFVDSKWKSNLKALRSRKIPVGAYHFYQPKFSPLEQAQHFLTHYTPTETDLPPVIDIEIEGANDADLRRDVRIWMNAVEEKTGRRPIIYTSYHMFTTKFSKHFSEEHFWIANYNNVPEKMKDKRILYWQYSDRGKLPGVPSLVDLNMSKIKF